MKKLEIRKINERLQKSNSSSVIEAFNKDEITKTKIVDLC